MKHIVTMLTLTAMITLGACTQESNSAEPLTEETESTSQVGTKILDKGPIAKGIAIKNDFDKDSNEHSIERALKERYIGDIDAPIVFYDFSSLSCPHCATFHNEILPQIKKNYIETGKVRMVFKSLPLNATALMGEQAARCFPRNNYDTIITLLYKNQQNWAFAQNPRQALLDLIKLSGYDQNQAMQCIDDKNLESAITEYARGNAVKYKINSTPTFVFDDGKEYIRGSRFYEMFEDMLDSLIKKETK